MTDVSPASLQRMRRISIAVQLMAYAGMALLLVGPAVIWAQPDLVRSLVVPQLGLGHRPVALDREALVGGFLAGLTSAAFYAYALWLTARLFGAFGRGDVFSPENVDRLRWLGWTLVAATAATPAARALQTAALTLGNPEGHRFVVVQIEPSTLAALLGGGVVVGFASVLREANRIADENRQFV